MTPQKNTEADDGALAPHTLGTGEPQNSSTGWREAAARIIDQLGFQLFDEVVRCQQLPQGDGPPPELMNPVAADAKARTDVALAKADQIASLPAPGGWREIESAPRDGTKVDLWAAERDRYVNERITDCRFSERDACWTHPRTIYDDESEDECAEVFNATHWVPLPEPPYSGGGKGE